MPVIPKLPEGSPGLERVSAIAREVIGGDQRAAVRRILLWVAALTFIVAGAPLWAVIPPLVLLMVTDGLL